MRRFHRSYRKYRGMAIAIILMIIFVVLLIGFAMSTNSMYNLNQSAKAKDSSKALYAAEAGLARAIVKIKNTPAWDGNTGGQKTFSEVSIPSSDGLNYTVDIYNNVGGATPVVGFRGIMVPAGSAYIVCTGKAGITPSDRATQYAAAMLKGSINPFAEAGLCGKDWVKLSGNVELSAYDSATNLVVGEEGDAMTNGTVTDDGGAAMTSNGNSADIDGSLFVGPGADLETALDAKHDGTYVSAEILDHEIPFPTVVLPTNLTNQSAVIANTPGIFASPSPAETSGYMENTKKAVAENTGNGFFSLAWLDRFEDLATGIHRTYYNPIDKEYSYRFIAMSSRAAGGVPGKPSPTPTATATTSSPTPAATETGETGASPTPSSTESATTPSNNSYSDPTYTLPAGQYDAMLNIGNHQVVELTGPGTYIFKGLDITAQGQLRINTTNGPVKIYMDGNVNLTGGSNCGLISQYNGTGVPKATDLVIMGTENCTTVNFTGNSDACFGLYAPSASINLRGNANFWGALVGESVWVHGNPAFYYDTALGRMSDLATGFSVSSIQHF